MQTVIVTNNSGIKLNLMGKKIKPLREHKGDQSFTFPTCAKAFEFEKAINGHPAKALKALYSPSEDDLKAEGYTVDMSGDATDGSGLDTKIAELAAKLEADNSKPELQALAESMALTDYADLNKGPLAELIAKAQLTA